MTLINVSGSGFEKWCVHSKHQVHGHVAVFDTVNNDEGVQSQIHIK